MAVKAKPVEANGAVKARPVQAKGAVSISAFSSGFSTGFS